MRKIFYSFFILLVLLLASRANAQLPAPVLTAPPDNATGVSLTPTFTWTAVSGALSYKLEVYTNLSLVLDISGITSTSYTVPSTTPLQGNTYYYWRVCAVGSGGPGNWAAYFHFTTTIAAPSAPVLVAPTNGATNVSVTPTMDWNDVSGASTYRIQISTTSSFGTTAVDVAGLTNSGYVVPSGKLTNSTFYYWRVNASNAGGTSGWSDIWNFTTIPALPPAPVLVYPLNNSTNIPVNVTLNWNDAAGATGYRVQVSLNSNFSSIVLDELPTASQYSIPTGVLSGTTQYFWRVSASNVAGFGDWSSTWHFTTAIAPPAAPQLLNPVNGATGVAISGTVFDWNTVAGANSYRIQISTDSTFGTTVLNTQIVNSQYTHTTPNFTYNTLYFWRVYATNSGGNGLWSQVWSFTTIEATLPAPLLGYPPNGATNIPLTPTMDWSDVSGATGYQLQISTTSSFSSTVLNVATTQSQYTVPSGILQGYTLYYWRVASRNSGGIGPYSSVWNFRTVQTFNLNLKVYLEGFWNGTTHVQDTVKVILAQNVSPFNGADTSLAVLGTNGTVGQISYARASSGNYYIVVKHRNHLETWSANAMYFSTGNTVNYDFTTSSSKAYGNNMKLVGSAWVLYGGDADGDGFISPADYEIFKTQFGMWGYLPCDYNGDWFIDGYDYPVQNNFGHSVIRPQ